MTLFSNKLVLTNVLTFLTWRFLNVLNPECCPFVRNHNRSFIYSLSHLFLPSLGPGSLYFLSRTKPATQTGGGLSPAGGRHRDWARRRFRVEADRPGERRERHVGVEAEQCYVVVRFISRVARMDHVLVYAVVLVLREVKVRCQVQFAEPDPARSKDTRE